MQKFIVNSTFDLAPAAFEAYLFEMSSLVLGIALIIDGIRTNPSFENLDTVSKTRAF